MSESEEILALLEKLRECDYSKWHSLFRQGVDEAILVVKEYIDAVY